MGTAGPEHAGHYDDDVDHDTDHDRPVCALCGDRIEGLVYDCGSGPEHIDCHYGDDDPDPHDLHPAAGGVPGGITR
ncbi:hypothetical protein [Frankia sp. Cas4]|uniref:hypothetical protein n=1 Tax=Frankia sp. Cas4 TaxID=3073927 RepID=UPI002AD2D150|nr:hypothetical protein [Frankia sp. Cas4]